MMARGRDDPAILDISVSWDTVSEAPVKSKGTTHRAVRWFPLVEACLDVCCEMEEGRYSRVLGFETMLILSWRQKFVDRG